MRNILWLLLFFALCCLWEFERGASPSLNGLTYLIVYISIAFIGVILAASAKPPCRLKALLILTSLFLVSLNLSLFERGLHYFLKVNNETLMAVFSGKNIPFLYVDDNKIRLRNGHFGPIIEVRIKTKDDVDLRPDSPKFNNQFSTQELTIEFSERKLILLEGCFKLFKLPAK